MKIIKCLSEKIEEELNDAQEYIDLAMRWKQDEPDTAEVFYNLSVEEMGHVDRLHKKVAELIAEVKEKSGDLPRDMMTLYEYLHEKHIAQATKIKVKQGMYKG